MFSKAPKIEDLILQALEGGTLDTKSLLSKIKNIRAQTSKPAFYKALRKMCHDEIVIKTGEHVSLSDIWLKRVVAFAERAERNYKTVMNPGSSFLNLKEGEKMAFTFKTFEATDVFWAHVFAVLSEMVPAYSPICTYAPHEWFLLARPESEILLIEHLKKMNKKLLVLAYHKNPLDIKAGHYFNGPLSQYFAAQEKLSLKSNYYVNMFGDFLVEVWLDQKVSDAIDAFYRTAKEFDEKAKQKLLNIVAQKGKNKLIISRNKTKSEKIHRVFKKYFAF